MIRWIPILMLTAAFTAAARAGEPFVQTDAMDVKAILAPPPANDSAQTRQEVEHLLQLQASRTDADIARIKSEVKLSPFLFSGVLGSWFNPDDLPVTAKFLTSVMQNADDISNDGKLIFKRDRPFNVDPRIEPCVKKEKSLSYPSGHSTRATVVALTLREIFPDHADALIARGKLVGDDREMAGEHFPSDVEAGRTLGNAIFQQMMKTPEFQAEMEKAKDECLAKEPAK